MNIICYLIIFIIIIYLIWRFVYSPKFTNFTRQQFIIESLKNCEYRDFEVNEKKKLKLNNRMVIAHWSSYRVDNISGVLVEFDVHPSVFPVTLSHSEFIHLKNNEHLNQIKQHLKNSDDYSPFLANFHLIEKLPDVGTP